MRFRELWGSWQVRVVSFVVVALVAACYVEVNVNTDGDDAEEARVYVPAAPGAPSEEIRPPEPPEAIEPGPPVEQLVEELVRRPPDEPTGLRPTFTPYTVAPDILNRNEVVRAMEREYPPLLRDAGIGGTVIVYFLIDEEGIVEQFQIFESSGHQALDDAALAVADVYRFSPALNRDKRVPVWVSFGITFQVR